MHQPIDAIVHNIMASYINNFSNPIVLPVPSSVYKHAASLQYLLKSPAINKQN